MAVDKLVDSPKLDAALGATADAIRAKTGDSSEIDFDLVTGTGFAEAVASIPSGGGASLENVEIYVLDFATDTITLTAGAMSVIGEYISV